MCNAIWRDPNNNAIWRDQANKVYVQTCKPPDSNDPQTANRLYDLYVLLIYLYYWLVKIYSH
jgi:hypothetical protein